MFIEKNIKDLNMNPYTLFAKKWAALSTGNQSDGYDAMMITWGTIGALWEKSDHSNRLPVITVFVRPSRYTNILMSEEQCFSVAVFDDNYKKVLGYFGIHSGKNEDKYAGAGITPIFEENTVYPEEARLVFICKKIYVSSLLENGFCDKELIDFNYSEKDFHQI